MVLEARLFSLSYTGSVLYSIQKTLKLNSTKTMKKNAFRSALFLVATLLIASCGSKDTSAQNKKPGAEAPAVDIHTAVVSDNKEAVKQHIAAGTNINEKDPFGGSSPLISAALFGKTEIAKILIDAGADINFQNNDGSTPLHLAAFFCRPEIVKMLLDKKADKTIKSKYGSTAYESVAGPYADVKPTYEMLEKMLSPMGLKLDYAYIEKTRPEVAQLLK
jgi:ankyrin repeat protein